MTPAISVTNDRLIQTAEGVPFAQQTLIRFSPRTSARRQYRQRGRGPERFPRPDRAARDVAVLPGNAARSGSVCGGHRRYGWCPQRACLRLPADDQRLQRPRLRFRCIVGF